MGMALGLAGAGADIVVAARNMDKTSQAQAEIEALGVKPHGLAVDVGSEADITEMVTRTIEAFVRVDIPVNNAGMTVPKEPQDLSVEEWDNVLDVNLRAAFLASRSVYPHMKGQGGGKIISVGSMFSCLGEAVAARRTLPARAEWSSYP